MATTLLQLLQSIGNELGRASGTCSASGTTTTIVDTSNDSPFDPDDSLSLYASAWAMIEADSAVTPLNVGEVRRVKDNGYTPDNGTVTLSRAFTSATTTTQSFAIYQMLPPLKLGTRKSIKDHINDALRQYHQRYLHLLTLVTDGDMETSGVTNWTANGTATVAKSTTTGVVLGDAALTVTCPATGDYVRTASIDVSSGSYHIAADVIAPNAYGAKLQLYDATNSAEIKAWTTLERNQRFFADVVNLPDSCKQVQLRLMPVTANASAVSYWDNLSLRPIGQVQWGLPSWFQHASWLEDIQYYEGCYIKENSLDSYDAKSRQPRSLPSWDVLEEPAGYNPFRATFSNIYGLAYTPVFACCLRPYSELSALTDSTELDADYLKAAVLTEIYSDANDKANTLKWRGRRDTIAYNSLTRASGRLLMGFRNY